MKSISALVTAVVMAIVSSPSFAQSTQPSASPDVRAQLTQEGIGYPSSAEQKLQPLALAQQNRRFGDYGIGPKGGVSLGRQYSVTISAPAR